MAEKGALTRSYRVASINEAPGTGGLSVMLVQQVDIPVAQAPYMTPAPPPGHPGSISLSVSMEEVGDFFPGKTFMVTFTPTDK